MKRYLKVTRTNQGVTVKVTLVEGGLTSSWSAKVASTEVKAGVKDADRYAKKGLEQLREALAEIELEETPE